MLNAIIDNLSRLDILYDQIPSVIQIVVIIFWIFITRRSQNSYKIPLVVSLILLSISIPVLVLSLSSATKIIGEYAFLFLGIGIIQMLISKEN